MPSSSRSTRWTIGFAILMAMSIGVGPLALSSISALSPLVVLELELSRTQLGSLSSAVFATAAAISILGGSYVSEFGGRRTLMWVFGSGGIAVVVVAGAQSLAWLIVGAVFAGASQGVANPATNELIAVHIEPGRQGLHIGVKQSGVQMAQALTGLTLPFIALLLGWRASLFVGLVPAVAGVLLIRAILPCDSRPQREPSKSFSVGVEPMVWWLAAYTFAISMTITTVQLHVPLYAFDQLRMPSSTAGMTTGIVGSTGLIARIAWSRWAGRQATPVGTLIILSSVATLALLLILGSSYAYTWMLWPGLVGFGSSALAANAVVMLTVIRLFIGRTIGRVTGFIGLGLFLGFMTGPVGFGALVDSTESYVLGWAAASMAGFGSLVVALLWNAQTRRN